ncbi:extracellular solute-binding protein [Paenibacillus agri]|uniref:Extracellular solute-binding protein n=1 Tax=Paenibacillus agri TaxID=2744309 RepID=A0A850EZF7_9BACL|nr:extracellular solute-binding protein [Paenibacillus agri]NUU63221.1 extracellular solute-binding protein [Paenibacillus agri]
MPSIHPWKVRILALVCVTMIVIPAGYFFSKTSSPGRVDSEEWMQDAKPEVTLKMYFGGEKKAATDEVWREVSQYVKSKGLNVNFSVNFIPWTDYSSKLLVMAAAGDRWDMNFDSDTSFRQMAARGSYLPLNTLLPEYAPHLNERYKSDGTLLSTTLDGEILGLPWAIKMNQRPYAVWRADLAELAGIAPPMNSIQTVEEVDTLLHQLKEAYPDRKLSLVTALPFYMVREEWLDLEFHGLGCYIGDPEMKVRAIEQQPFYLEAALMSKRWNQAGILNPDSILGLEDSANHWRSGKLLFTITSHEWAYAADPGFIDSAYRQQVSLLYPEKRQVNRRPTSNVIAINRNSEHPDLALRFLDLLETDRALFDLVIYGMEGKTYKLEGDTVRYPDNLNFSTSNYMDWGGQWGFWKPQFLRPTETYPGDFWNKEATFAELPQNVDSPLGGLMLSDYKIGKALERRDELYEDLGKAIEYGMEGNISDAIAKYRQRQMDNGLETIIAEVQRQVDQYLLFNR